MSKCRMCGEEFDVEGVIAEYDGEYDMSGHSYDEDYPNHDMCLRCAIDMTEFMKDDGLIKK